MTFPHKKPGRSGWHRDASHIYASSLFPAQHKQLQRLAERKSAAHVLQIHVGGLQFSVFPGVYQTSVDTDLMSRVISLRPNDTFLEIGCGCGAISLLASRQCKYGIGVDINPLAVTNANHNRNCLGIQNVDFIVSDVFERIVGKYNVLICNPPYNEHVATDTVERMFWDPGNDMKSRVFRNARDFMRANGRLYFGWANFADLDVGLPLRMAEHYGLRYMRHYMAASPSGVQRFLVIEFRPR